MLWKHFKKLPKTKVVEKPKSLITACKEVARRKHFSLVTERTYLRWIRSFLLFNNKIHPRALGPQAIGIYLTHLAAQRNVSPSTQNQALNALIFLYREMLEIEINELKNIEFAKRRVHVPVSLSKNEVKDILNSLTGTKWLICSLMYGAGLRLSEALRIRVKDLDFEKGCLLIRDSKSSKDRVVMMPTVCIPRLKAHLKSSKWDKKPTRCHCNCYTTRTLR